LNSKIIKYIVAVKLSVKYIFSINFGKEMNNI